jgi:hypothetical protein
LTEVKERAYPRLDRFCASAHPSCDGEFDADCGRLWRRARRKYPTLGVPAAVFAGGRCFGLSARRVNPRLRELPQLDWLA